MTRSNLYSSRPATSGDVVRTGILTLLSEAKRLTAKSAWLICPQKSNLDGHLAQALGEAACESLARGNSVQVDGTLLSFYGARSLPHSGDGSPVLGCYPSEKLLARLDSMKNLPSLIVLPWTLAEAQNWIDAHGPVDIFRLARPQKLTVANPVVIKALDTLGASINVSTGVTHPSDKRSAIEVFRLLQGGSETYTPGEVRAWFVQMGMRADHANAIAAIAADPTRYRSRTGSVLRPDLLRRWQEEAASDQSI